MKQSKDRIKDGLMLIMVMVGVMIAGMTLTACSDEEMPDYNPVLSDPPLGRIQSNGIIELDSLINSKIFREVDHNPETEYPIIIPDSLSEIEAGPAIMIWSLIGIDRNTNSFIYTDTITVEGNKYLRVPCITEIRQTEINSRSEIPDLFEEQPAPRNLHR